MVGRGVMDAVGDSVGRDVFVLVGSGDGVIVDSCITVTDVIASLGAQAVRNKIPPNKAIKIRFNVFLLILYFLLSYLITTKTQILHRSFHTNLENWRLSFWIITCFHKQVQSND